MDKHIQNEVTRMRFSPTKILQGLLCTTPVLVLTLAACGGGGGGGSNTTTLAAAYTVGGTVSGVSAAGLVLRNNGGDDKAISSADATYTFGTSIIAGTSYNVTVLSNPGNLLCSVANSSGTMPAYNVTNANVTCVPAHTISVSISGLSGTVVLQNNGADNLLVSGNVTVAFNTPVAAGGNYDVTVLTQPDSPARQICTPASPSGSGISGPVTVSISCAADPTPAADRFAYTANYGGGDISAFAIAASGVLSPSAGQFAGNGPSSIAADAASHVYATNQSSNTISGFKIKDTSGALDLISDVDAGTSGIQGSIPTGPAPVAIKIHPSGKFAYVANSGATSAADANSISAYSIDASTGALARIDTDGTKAGTQYFIPARVTPSSIAIDSAGTFAYVANVGSNNVTVYSIDATSGALAEIQTITTGTTPYSIAVDPTGTYAYVTSWNTDKVWIFSIGVDGTLSAPTQVSTGTGPRAIKIDSSGKHAYVVNSSSGDISAYIISGSTLNLIDCSASVGVCDVATRKYFQAGNTPKSISIDSSGKYAYVANTGSNNVSAFSIDSFGALIPVANSPIASGASPYAVTTVK
jgi:YVTN family beta-propeller protein